MDYLIVNGQTVAERWNYANGSEYFTMRYTFDETGSVIGFSTHYPNFTNGYWEDYLFAKNLQGDVVAMYLITVEPPRLIATYEYDEWGKVKTVRDATGAILTDPAHLANRNPFRYRGYHYDTETGFYYLQSRYYDPAISRFINADSYASSDRSFIGCNMYTYCYNNPIVWGDFNGEEPMSVTSAFPDGEVAMGQFEMLYYEATGEAYEHPEIPVPVEFGWTTYSIQVEENALYENQSSFIAKHSDILSTVGIIALIGTMATNPWISIPAGIIGSGSTVGGYIGVLERDDIPECTNSKYGLTKYTIHYSMSYYGEVTEYFSDQYYPRYGIKIVHVTRVYYLDNSNGNFYDGNTKRKIGKVMMSTQ